MVRGCAETCGRPVSVRLILRTRFPGQKRIHALPHLRPFQYTLQAEPGTHAVAAHVRTDLELQDDAILVSLDGRSAYDATSRASFLTVLAATYALVESSLWVGNGCAATEWALLESSIYIGNGCFWCGALPLVCVSSDAWTAIAAKASSLGMWMSSGLLYPGHRFRRRENAA